MNTETTTAEPPTPIRLFRPHPAGKIARLPADLREQINEWITDNISYEEIISRLEAAGHHGINSQNLSNWAHSGYQLWLRNRERLEVIRLQSEANCDLLRELESTDPAASIRLNSLYISTQLAQLMNDIDLEVLKQKVLENPAHYFRLARTVHAQTLETQRQQKIQLAIDKQRQVQLALEDRQLADLGMPRKTTSDEGYNAAAAYFGLPPRFSVNIPIPQKSKPTPQTEPTQPSPNQPS